VVKILADDGMARCKSRLTTMRCLYRAIEMTGDTEHRAMRQAVPICPVHFESSSDTDSSRASVIDERTMPAIAARTPVITPSY
jgi:hypothetical protein